MAIQTYHVALMAFVERLRQDQIRGAQAKGQPEEIVNQITVFSESGRKYDKVFINSEVRYFVDRATGTIYGRRSPTTPNFKWYFGDIYRFDKWDWSGLQGVPITDETARYVKTYGPYAQYIKI